MKGISTYDYILAMRERDQLNGAGERLHSPYASPASSVATAMSGASSMVEPEFLPSEWPSFTGWPSITRWSNMERPFKREGIFNVV